MSHEGDEVRATYRWRTGRRDVEALPEWARTLMESMAQALDGSLSKHVVVMLSDTLGEAEATLSCLSDEVQLYMHGAPDSDREPPTEEEVMESIRRLGVELDMLRKKLLPPVDDATHAAVLQQIMDWPMDRAHDLLGFVVHAWDRSVESSLTIRCEGNKPVSVSVSAGKSWANAQVLDALEHSAAWKLVWTPQIGGYVAN